LKIDEKYVKEHYCDQYTEIIEGFLCQSNEKAVEKDKDFLKKNGIKNVLNVNSSPSKPTIGWLSSCWNGRFFWWSFRIIDSAKQRKERIVHCEVGINRSGTVVVGYLMKTNNGVLEMLLNLCFLEDQANSCVKQLLEFEKEWIGMENPSITIDEYEKGFGQILENWLFWSILSEMC